MARHDMTREQRDAAAGRLQRAIAQGEIHSWVEAGQLLGCSGQNAHEVYGKGYGLVMPKRQRQPRVAATVSLTSELAYRLDVFMQEQDLPSRASTIRNLLEKYLPDAPPGRP